MILRINKDLFSLNSINHLMYVMVKCCVLFEVRTEFLYIFDELRLQRVKELPNHIKVLSIGKTEYELASTLCHNYYINMCHVP
jgi:hypothetical protein